MATKKKNLSKQAIKKAVEKVTGRVLNVITDTDKRSAAEQLINGEKSAVELGEFYGVSANSIYNWRNKYLKAGEDKAATGATREDIYRKLLSNPPEGFFDSPAEEIKRTRQEELDEELIEVFEAEGVDAPTLYSIFIFRHTGIQAPIIQMSEDITHIFTSTPTSEPPNIHHDLGLGLGSISWDLEK